MRILDSGFQDQESDGVNVPKVGYCNRFSDVVLKMESRGSSVVLLKGQLNSFR